MAQAGWQAQGGGYPRQAGNANYWSTQTSAAAPPSGNIIPPQGQHQGATGQLGMPVPPPQKRPPPPADADQGPYKQLRAGPGGYPGAPAGAAGAAPVPPAAGAPAGAPPQAGQPPVKESYIVSSTGRDADEVVVRTLQGEYVEKGVNHGRKVYMKLADRSVPDYVDVLMYYWDNRDGPSFEGWWFGNKLGGTQVWSHCKSNDYLPPGHGWKIPWDGAVRPTLSVKSKEAALKAEAEEKLHVLNDEVTRKAAEANHILEQAQGASSSGMTSGFAEAEQLLAPQVPVLAEVMKKVQDCQRFASGEVAQSFQQLGSTVRNLHEAFTTELNNMQNARQKAEHDQKQKATEERDSHVLEEILPEAIEKTNTAEDMVEKTVITSEMIVSCGDDDDMVKHSIEETERSAKAAQSAIGEARIYLNAKLALTRRFVEKVREQASTELGKLQQQLQEAQNKLNPLKSVRQDYQQRKDAQKLVSEVEERVVLAEVDIDRAEEMITMLNSDTPTPEGLAQAQTALQTADSHINKAMSMYESKKSSATGIPLEELCKLGPRGEAGRKRIVQLRTSLKEASERITAEGYIDEASSKFQAVAEALAKLEASEAQFEDVTEVSVEDTMASVKTSEAAAATAQTASSMARMFIQMKVLEVKRFSGGPAAESTAKLTEFQKQLEVATKRLAELKASVNRRKRMALVKEAETRVSDVEALVEKVREAASIFADDAQLMAMSAEQIREASERTSVCEKEANLALMEVRKYVTARQIEAKGKDATAEVSSELIKFATRLSTAQTELAKQRKLFTSVEQRLAVKRLVEEAGKKLKETEEKVAKALEAIAGLESLEAGPGENGKDPNKSVKEAELAVQEAQIATRTTLRFMEAQSRSQGFAKDSIAKLEPRAKACQEKIEAASTQVKELSEKLFVRSICQEAEGKLSECKVALDKAAEAELPLLQGGDGTGLDKAAVALYEKAIQAAHLSSSNCKTFLAMKRLAVKRQSEATIAASNEAFGKIQTAVDESMKKVSEMRTRCAELKRAALKAGAGKGAARKIG